MMQESSGKGIDPNLNNIEAWGGIYKTGFQHFGLIINMFHNKAFVISVSENYCEYMNAYDRHNSHGKKYLM